MANRRKYEPAGGVVSLAWQKGTPCSGDQWGRIVVEVWRSSLATDWRTDQPSRVEIRAELVPLRWRNNEWQCDGASYEVANCRRWARLGATSASVPLTLGVWQ